MKHLKVTLSSNNMLALLPAIVVSFLGWFAISAAVASTSLQLEWESQIADTHPLVGGVYLKDGAITVPALAALMADNKYVLIGEKHDNSDHHQLELRLLKLLKNYYSDAGTDASVSVTLEMLDGSQQPKLDEIMWQLDQNNELSINTDELKTALSWPQHGWPWSDYAPLIEWTLSSRMLLSAGNISHSTMKSIYASGIDDRFSSASELKTALNDRLLDQVFDGHCGLMPKDSLSSMVDIQLVKDAAMANALVDSGGTHSVLVAGTGHIRKDSAVPQHLRVLDDASVLTIALVEVVNDKKLPADYSELFEQFDVLVFTPIANERDYCADLEKSLHKK
jgi:uncharacterized iron-regulated protein